MNNCLFCYKPLETGEYHTECSRRFFGTTQVPVLELDREKLSVLAQTTVSKRLALTGVQPKISLGLVGEKDNKRLTLVGLWGDYILKPQSEALPFVPEIEDLTMHLAKLFSIETAEHALIRDTTGTLAYITKRFDRKKGKKIHVEDLCQLSELLTEQKYKSSYERVGKVIRQFTTNQGLDTNKYFKLVLFSFLTGNNDMHLKNFSLMHMDNGIILAPAYDLLNVNLIYPEDKEDVALFLGGRKSKIKRSDFDRFAISLGIADKVRDNIYIEFSNQANLINEWIERSFLNDSYKGKYAEIVIQKFKQIGL